MRRFGDLMRKNFKILLLTIFTIIALPLIMRAEGKFERFDLKTKGQVKEVISEDLDSDGLLDLVVVNIDVKNRPYKRYLTIFMQDKEKGFSGNKSTEWELPRNVAAVDVGDIGPAPGRELVFITEQGISFAPVVNGEVGPLSEVLSIQSIVAIASPTEAPYYNFVWDYTGDGKDDILVCGFSNSMIAINQGNYEFKNQTINLKPEIDIFVFDIDKFMVSSEHPVFRVSYQVPKVYSEDYNADGLPDLLVPVNENIVIFEQAEGKFTKDPVKTYYIKLFEQEDGRRENPVFIKFKDIDNDGKVDAVAAQMHGRVGSMQSRAVLFWGKSKNIEDGEPDMEFETEHTVMGNVIIWDVNKDGLLDLIMPTYDISAWNIGMTLFTGEIKLEWAYFLQTADHAFNKTPDRTIITDMKMNLRKFRLESGIPNIVADFNADGYPDQALGEDENVLGITLRDAQGEPMDLKEKIDVPVSMFFQGVDFNKDGFSDILMYYVEQKEYKNEIRVLMNKGDWKEKP